jgi:hypothetical protein
VQVVHHVSIVVFKKSFVSIRDAFRFFVAGCITASAPLTDTNLEHHSVSVAQLSKGINELLLKLRPSPNPSERAHGWSWGKDVADVLMQVQLHGFLSAETDSCQHF